MTLTHCATSPFDEMLGPGGLFAKSLSGYEFRPAQIEMASVVANAMNNHKTAMIEAGTGTGKTVAYLLPLIHYDLRCLISTGTKNLQTQLVSKDIPLLEKSFKKKIRAYSLKGRANYLCWRRWKRFLSRPVLSMPGLNEALKYMSEWVTYTKTGEQSELEWLSSENDILWSEICSKTETCQGQMCKNYESCFVTKARQEAASAQIVVVNHHLLMADCCLRERSGLRAIPNYSRLIIDEAHMLEQIATEYFGLAVSNRRVQELIGDLKRQITEEDIEDKDIDTTLEMLSRRAFAFFESLLWITEDRFSINEQVITKETGVKLRFLISTLGILSSQLDRLFSKYNSLNSIQRRTHEIISALEFIYDHSDTDFVFWGERQNDFISLKISPIDVSKQMAANLWKPLKGIVLTSATLSANQDFSYIKSRLGVESHMELILDSHFDYRRQAVIFIPHGLPRPTEEGFSEQLGPRISKILQITRGRALLLFTSYRNLNKVYQYLKKEDLGYTLLRQGDSPQKYLIERFCKDISSVLLATSSFWHGVDVPGEALSCVVIDRLPFSVPTDPITEARINWIRNRGGNPFWEFQLPSAIIMLKQGIGRLIRHRDDRGLMVILDSRIYTKSYGSVILKDLPDCHIIRSLDNINDLKML